MCRSRDGRKNRRKVGSFFALRTGLVTPLWLVYFWYKRLRQGLVKQQHTGSNGRKQSLMRLTPERGLQDATKKAIAATPTYQQAQRQYGRLIEPYLGDAPRTLGLAHLVRVNPKLLTAPDPTPDRRRGFMFATMSMANTAGVAWESLDTPVTCAYVWGRDINAASKNLYQQQAHWFPTIGEDFWKCSYLKHAFGEAAFSVIWNQRDVSQATVYDSLLYAVNAMRRSLPGTTVVRQRYLAMVDCAYVFEMANRGGGMYSTGYGIEPVLSKSAYRQVFN